MTYNKQKLNTFAQETFSLISPAVFSKHTRTQTNNVHTHHITLIFRGTSSSGTSDGQIWNYRPQNVEIQLREFISVS